MARHRSREPESGERAAAQRRLDEHRDDARAGVEQAEETDERRSFREMSHRLDLHRVVGERADRGRQQDDERQVPQVRVAPDEGERRLTVSCLVAVPPAGSATPDDEGADGGESGSGTEPGEQNALRTQGSDALCAEAAQESPERRRPRDAGHEGLGRVRVEALVEERPPRRDGDAAQNGVVEVEDRRRRTGHRLEERPLQQEERTTRRQEPGHDPHRTQAGQQTARPDRRRKRQSGGGGREPGQGGDVEVRQEESVAAGVRRDLLRDQNRGDRGRQSSRAAVVELAFQAGLFFSHSHSENRDDSFQCRSLPCRDRCPPNVGSAMRSRNRGRCAVDRLIRPAPIAACSRVRRSRRPADGR